MDITNARIRSIASRNVERFGKQKNYSLCLFDFKYEFHKKKKKLIANNKYIILLPTNPSLKHILS